MHIYHLVGKQDFKKYKDEFYYSPPSLDREGFIHCSTEEQVDKTARRRFKDVKDLLLLTIDPQKVKAKIQYDFVPSQREEHPHIYGRLSLKAIEKILEYGVGN